ncbi:hypothetical protein SAMN05421771_1848 [Granulicella pectinivorans]|uniref:Uncharacterized protein n=1 Tax=Granulicella pectinivorans TaxID=474950 RepID=A0A1I6M545_9BACT|nr:hypothetical protein [Granulicella pectinivorans]SFS10791.1 hypothetical protein SAMN05421771_1848 [Granulicella pectinivorans]
MSLYRTRNQGVCAIMRYVYGPAVHIATFIEQPKGATFLIDDVEGRCAEIARAYHRDDNGPGFPIEDPKTLLDEFIATRHTLTAAIQDGKHWRTDLCPRHA